MRLPITAYHACRYADWTDGTFCRLPRAAAARPLPAAERHASIICAALNATSLPRVYNVSDTHGDRVYATPAAPRLPAYTDWQAEVISAVQRMRRWRLYSDSPA